MIANSAAALKPVAVEAPPALPSGYLPGIQYEVKVETPFYCELACRAHGTRWIDAWELRCGEWELKWTTRPELHEPPTRDSDEAPQYRPCPHCGQSMALSRGLYLCANISTCGYTEPLDAALVADPAYLSLLRARRRALRGPRLSY